MKKITINDFRPVTGYKKRLPRRNAVSAGQGTRFEPALESIVTSGHSAAEA